MMAGVYGVNCYLVYDESKEGIVVDPGGDVDEILEVIKENDLDVKYIVLTHGHGDHIGGLMGLKAALDVPVMVHEFEKELLMDGSKNLSPTMAMGKVEVEPDILLKDGDKIKVGNSEILVIHTPGHTKGGISLKIGDNILTGDTLFKGSIGRTDLLGGNYEQIIESIKTKILVYPDETMIHPGHGPSSTIASEKTSNPFLK